jgi:hypothetical protein
VRLTGQGYIADCWFEKSCEAVAPRHKWSIDRYACSWSCSCLGSLWPKWFDSATITAHELATASRQNEHDAAGSVPSPDPPIYRPTAVTGAAMQGKSELGCDQQGPNMSGCTRSIVWSHQRKLTNTFSDRNKASDRMVAHSLFLQGCVVFTSLMLFVKTRFLLEPTSLVLWSCSWVLCSSSSLLLYLAALKQCWLLFAVRSILCTINSRLVSSAHSVFGTCFSSGLWITRHQLQKGFHSQNNFFLNSVV